jgi:hypothetical protein
MKYCFYRMTVDSGFAPNPYFGYCTLAACTPNHQRARLDIGDVIIGYESEHLKRQRLKKFGGKTPRTNALIYYMKVEKILTLDEYFRSKEFSKKVPDQKSRDYRKRVGDNAYFRNKNGVYDWVRGHAHNSDCGSEITPTIAQDLKGDTVFIARDYFYFGDKAVPFPEKFIGLVPQRGIKYCHHPLPELDRYVRASAARHGGGKIVGHPISASALTCRKLRDAVSANQPRGAASCAKK